MKLRHVKDMMCSKPALAVTSSEESLTRCASRRRGMPQIFRCGSLQPARLHDVACEVRRWGEVLREMQEKWWADETN